MSIVSVSQMWSQNGGSFTNPKADGLDIQYRLTEAWLVVCTVGTTISEILTASGLPQNGQAHSVITNAFATSVDPAQISPICWQVNIGYEGETADPETTEIEWSDVTSTEPIDRDYDGNAILTANGEQVDGLTMEISDQVAVITKKFLTIDLPSVALYRHATNSDTFLGWPPGTARLIGFSARNKYKYGQAQEQ